MEAVLNNFLLGSSLILLVSVLLSKSSASLGLPILIIFTLIGMVSGSEGLGGIHFDNHELAYTLSLIAMCLIIFSGGIETDLKGVKKNLKRGILLSSLGVLITTCMVGLMVKFLTDLSVLESLLLGAILSATDAAAVFSAFKDRTAQVTAINRNILKFESGSNDPMAYLLVTVLLGLIGEGDTSGAVLAQFIYSPVVGFVIGWLLSRLFIYLNNLINLDYLGLYPALTLSFVFMGYSLAGQVEGNGFLAVYVFGLLISSQKIVHKKLLYSFYDGISWLSQIGLFVMLGLLVFPSKLLKVAPQAIIVALFLIFLARPVAVFICLIKSRFSFKDKVFVSWAGLKGATPIVFASLAAVKMGERADILFNIVFFVVLLSAVIQGATLKPVARSLGLLYEAIEDPKFPIDREVLEKTKNGIKELTISAEFFAVEQRVVDLNLPLGCLVLFIKRDRGFIIPDGSTRFQIKDRILLVTKNKSDLKKAVERFKYPREEEPAAAPLV